MNKRPMLHPEYYALDGYQRLMRFSDEYMADYLGMCVRSYREKKKGYSDFKNSDALKIAKLFNKTLDEIFAT